jgi:hypothetical protein
MPEVKGGGEQKNKNRINGGHNSHNYFFFVWENKYSEIAKLTKNFHLLHLV